MFLPSPDLVLVTVPIVEQCGHKEGSLQSMNLDMNLEMLCPTWAFLKKSEEELHKWPARNSHTASKSFNGGMPSPRIFRMEMINSRNRL